MELFLHDSIPWSHGQRASSSPHNVSTFHAFLVSYFSEIARNRISPEFFGRLLWSSFLPHFHDWFFEVDFIVDNFCCDIITVINGVWVEHHRVVSRFGKPALLCLDQAATERLDASAASRLRVITQVFCRYLPWSIPTSPDGFICRATNFLGKLATQAFFPPVRSIHLKKVFFDITIQDIRNASMVPKIDFTRRRWNAFDMVVRLSSSKLLVWWCDWLSPSLSSKIGATTRFHE